MIALACNSLYGPSKRLGVIRDLTISIERGEVLCILGKSASGKTTLIQLLCGLQQPFKGQVDVFGKKLQRASHHVGAALGDPGFLTNATIYQNLYYKALAHGVPNPKERCESIIDALQLRPFRDKTSIKCSNFVQALLKIALAVIRRPDILLLDDPFLDLDPQEASFIISYLKTINRKYKTTLIVCARSVKYLEAIATHYGVLSDGGICYYASANEVAAHCKTQITIQTESISATLAFLEDQFPNSIFSFNAQGQIIAQKVDKNLLSKALHRCGAVITELSTREVSIEDYLSSFCKEVRS